MSRLNKISASLSILFFFSLVVLSVSFPALGPSVSVVPQYVKFHGSLNGAGRADSKTLGIAALIEEEGDLRFHSKELPVAEKGMGPLLLLNSWMISASRIVFAPKAPGYLFQSVLNL
jgi:hypothetical protein